VAKKLMLKVVRKNKGFQLEGHGNIIRNPKTRKD
jgi:hypothetical protein